MAPGSKSMAGRMDSLSQQLAATAESIRNDPTSFERLDKERSKLVESAEALLKVLKPADLIMDSMVTLIQFTAIRLFIEWKASEAIPSDGSVSHSDLAAKIGAEVPLMIRLAAVLVSTGVLTQVGDDQLAHTRVSSTLVSGSPMTAIVKISFDDQLLTLHSMPAYFAKYGLREPTGRYKTIFAFAAGDPDLTVWEHMNRFPERKANFMGSMVAMSSRIPMTGSYDFSWILNKMSDAGDRALVVDVGGGSGHALQAIVKATQGLPMSRCVVEDLDAVVEEAKATAAVKAAFVYYIRRCLHDYGDKDCVEILEQIRKAMAEDSRLLIVEQVLGNPPSPLAAAADVYMSTLGGKERTLEGFEAIASLAGLRIAKVAPNSGLGCCRD
ncbi:Demethylsterigmatocystin 6-O-methyltransferase [Tolypocladium ophioglossoides CBS 100239]|uniref:Demethylsterigmatocystin 6-O-methyltransferase n=1 Tax=Tolypocladium ophioglossoides (strain CBS 100239) TaxID=1163406 RepID=A0A0L0NE98_TOLOC|nr:Demethylsterigmatocystin 6-O-methyltransferase [Tolypocladium ophioglossoides CBS 100239]